MPTNTELVQQVFNAINAHDVDALRGLWADDVEERFPDKTCRGKEELSAHFKGLFAALPDFRMELVHAVEDGDTVFARWTLTATHTGGQFNGIDTTGKAIALDGMDHFTFRDGRMASNFVIFDQMEVGRQLGLLPPDGSPPDRALKAAFNAKTKIAEAIRNARS
ncbi:MAG TPA: nuclear transport factor 2 family protein [Solirubrobacteraceae bacterium]|nr:nuclear transport factor 2 family protein [Solirubrobacteraceae bacterium]